MISPTSYRSYVMSFQSVLCCVFLGPIWATKKAGFHGEIPGIFGNLATWCPSFFGILFLVGDTILYH